MEKKAEITEVEVVKPSVESGTSGKKKIIVAVVIVVVIVAVIGIFLLNGEDNGKNGDNGNGNNPPIADFSYSPTEIYTNQTVSFDAAASTDPDEDELEYSWNFDDPDATSGNPNTDSGVTASHIYTMPGVYNVTLVVDDGNEGGTGEKIENITVIEEETPTATIVAAIFPTGAGNLEWTITVTDAEGTSAQLVFDNIYYNIYNGTNTDEPKLTGPVSELAPIDNEPPLHNDDGIYFNDNSDSMLSVGDFFSIAGDGDASVQAEDTFELMYKPPYFEEGVSMSDLEPLPS